MRSESGDWTIESALNSRSSLSQVDVDQHRKTYTLNDADKKALKHDVSAFIIPFSNIQKTGVGD